MTQKTNGWIPDEFSGTAYSPRRKKKAKRETIAEFEPTSRDWTAARKESSSRLKPASKPSSTWSSSAPSPSSTSAVKPKKPPTAKRGTAPKRKAGMVSSEAVDALVDERIRAIEQDLTGALSEIEKRLDSISDQALGAANQAKEAERLARERGREEWEAVNPRSRATIEKEAAGAAAQEVSKLENRNRKLLEALSETEARVQEAESRARGVVGTVEQSVDEVRTLVGNRGGEGSMASTSRKSRTISPSKKVDINSITFEELRMLGFSATQSARLIAMRDIQTGFTSFEEIRALRDFPPDLLEKLEERVTIG